MSRASVSCSVKFGAFRWNRSGYAEVMASQAVQDMARRPAERIAAQCNSTFTPKGGEGDGYRAYQCKGRLARGWRVSTQTPHAHNSERRHNRLLKAMGGGQ